MSVKQLEQLFGATVKFVPEISSEANSLYAVATSDGIPVFDVVVSNLTREVKISFPDTSEVELPQKVRMTTTVTTDGVLTRPSAVSVKEIVYPQIISLLVKHYGG